MYSRNQNSAVEAFAEGKAKKNGAVISTGKQLFYHGNLIAEWKNGGLYISNGGYVTYSKYNGTEIAGSMTTKKYLNGLPSVSINQAKCKWFLNGKEWGGEWVRVKGAKAPAIDPDTNTKKYNVFSTETRYVKTDGWRGYSEPKYAVCGANDTGMFEDSPCPSNVREKELNEAKAYLESRGIKTQEQVCETSNVFCVHVYLLAPVHRIEDARKIFAEYYERVKDNTRLLYAVK
jgi:hypothetical protein